MITGKTIVLTRRTFVGKATPSQRIKYLEKESSKRISDTEVVPVKWEIKMSSIKARPEGSPRLWPREAAPGRTWWAQRVPEQEVVSGETKAARAPGRIIAQKGDRREPWQLSTSLWGNHRKPGKESSGRTEWSRAWQSTQARNRACSRSHQPDRKNHCSGKSCLSDGNNELWTAWIQIHLTNHRARPEEVRWSQPT